MHKIRVKYAYSRIHIIEFFLRFEVVKHNSVNNMISLGKAYAQPKDAVVFTTPILLPLLWLYTK